MITSLFDFIFNIIQPNIMAALIFGLIFSVIDRSHLKRGVGFRVYTILGTALVIYFLVIAFARSLGIPALSLSEIFDFTAVKVAALVMFLAFLNYHIFHWRIFPRLAGGDFWFVVAVAAMTGLHFTLGLLILIFIFDALIKIYYRPLNGAFFSNLIEVLCATHISQDLSTYYFAFIPVITVAMFIQAIIPLPTEYIISVGNAISLYLSSFLNVIFSVVMY